MPRGAVSWLATPFDPSPNRGGLPPWAAADVDVRLGNLPGGSHPFDKPARATQNRGQVIDAKHRLDDVASGWGLGLIGQSDGAKVSKGGLAAGGWCHWRPSRPAASWRGSGAVAAAVSSQAETQAPL